VGFLFSRETSRLKHGAAERRLPEENIAARQRRGGRESPKGERRGTTRVSRTSPKEITHRTAQSRKVSSRISGTSSKPLLIIERPDSSSSSRFIFSMRISRSISGSSGVG